MMLDVKSFQLQSFLPLPYEEVLAPRLKRAHEKLQSGSGAGGEFTGWVHLPRDYDREEFARIQAAASRIRANSQALVVIGIGGSYLGARGVIDCLCSPNYNLKHKSTPNIYFIGNGLSSDALDEVLELCTLDERLVPCVDFGHLYARSLGELEGTAACASMLDRIEAVLGAERAGAFHSHFSKIQFTPNGGEKMHLTFAQDDFGPDPAPLMAEVARRGWSPTFICESAGTQAEDALTMKKLYQACQK